MRHHADHGLLQKHKSDLDPDHPRVFVQWLRYGITRIMVFFKIINFSSGPDLSYTQSYTSILRLGLAAGDTPDAPYYHLETRRSNSTHKMPNCTDSSGCLPEDLRQLGSVSRGEAHTSKSPTSIRLSLFELRDHRESRRQSRSRYSSI
ncbi:hypothetical protein F511_15849 [Dorcoceras hygrometricum]|uniref:Uncharacterized protein n=1 Tax=Dorcoceras hygrometricum TaxID=472368 RepID=A0A2Z7CEM6_9LAMI|nr:hypothetical protein F511_15849 [Dorcoceras hygrometricum]